MHQNVADTHRMQEIIAKGMGAIAKLLLKQEGKRNSLEIGTTFEWTTEGYKMI